MDRIAERIQTRARNLFHTLLSSLILIIDRVFRRTLDIGVSLMGLIILSPLFLLIRILLKRESSGPVLYRGLRAGLNGRLFHIFKFRTMYDHPESYNGPPITAGDDPRITPLGRWLRDTKLNELPQLWNVLKGEMSLVGPRPVPTYEAQRYAAQHRERLATLPGITGLWQVTARSEASFDDAIAIDMEYINNQSLWLDIKILLLTIPAVLSGKGAG